MQTARSAQTDAVGTPLNELDTPALVVDADLLEQNMHEMLRRIPTSVAVRPHLKTGKCVEIARLLLKAGCRGICVAKISEAEVFAAAGIGDILITSEIVGERKQRRLIELARTCPDLRVVVDDAGEAHRLNSLAAHAHLERPINVLIELNVGQNRTGVQSKEAALALADSLSELPHLRLIGVQGYEGHLQHRPADEREKSCRGAMAMLLDCVRALRAKGYPVPVVTAGGTGTCEICASCEGITEVQPGSFIFMDVAYRNATAGQFKNALSVLGTVISKTCPERVVVDAGVKSLSTDMGNAEPKDRALSYRPAGDEYGIVECKSGAAVPLALADKLELLPGHIDTTVALFDQYMVVRDGKLVDVWPITARGKVQ